MCMANGAGLGQGRGGMDRAGQGRAKLREWSEARASAA